jgi:hypothetical protein
MASKGADMTYDPGTAQLLRDDLVGLPVTEKKMFGGICFMLNGHMLCSTLEGGAMYRVGPQAYDHALTLAGTGPMLFTKRPMKGFVECAFDALHDDDKRAAILALALSFVKSLPPK